MVSFSLLSDAPTLVPGPPVQLSAHKAKDVHKSVQKPKAALAHTKMQLSPQAVAAASDCEDMSCPTGQIPLSCTQIGDNFALSCAPDPFAGCVGMTCPADTQPESCILKSDGEYALSCRHINNDHDHTHDDDHPPASDIDDHHDEHPNAVHAHTHAHDGLDSHSHAHLHDDGDGVGHFNRLPLLYPLLIALYIGAFVHGTYFYSKTAQTRKQTTLYALGFVVFPLWWLQGGI